MTVAMENTLTFLLFSFLLGIQVYHLFGLFWIGNWILALGECVLAGAFATYYWTFDKKVHTQLYTWSVICLLN